MKIDKKKVYKIISIFLLAFMFLYLLYDASKQSFWSDELEWTVAFVHRHSLFQMLKLLSIRGYNLPLYYVILFPLYKVAPYGERWILLLNFILILLGIWNLKKIGEKIGGEDLGFFSLALATVSYILLYQGGFQLRPYALLFCCSAFAFYRYLLLLDDSTTKNKILYAIALILLCYTHWYGCLITVFYFLVEAVRFLYKKEKISFILPYIALGVSFLPWLITLLVNNQLNVFEYWSKVPGFDALYEVVRYLLSENWIGILLFVFGAFLTFLFCFYRKEKKVFSYLLCIGSLFWCVCVIFLYGHFINQEGTLYVLRYYMVVMPHVLLIAAIPLAELMNLEVKMNSKKVQLDINGIPINSFVMIFICLAIIGVFGISSYQKAHQEVLKIKEPYREVSSYVAHQKDAYDGNGALMVSEGPSYLLYYFQKKGVEIPKHTYCMEWELYRTSVEDDHIKSTKVDEEEILEYDRLYVFLVSTTNFTDKFWEIVQENYELKEENPSLQFYVYQKKEA